jgi:hypothetical protein
MERDLARRRHVEELLAAGAAEQGPDFYHAAMVFQRARTAPPPTTEFEAGDPLPWPPDGLTARHGPGRFAALRPSGEWAVSWQRGAMPLILPWREQDGAPPQPEPAEVDGAPAIWCARVFQAWSLLVVARPDQPPWMVSGNLTRDELARVAASLP